MGKVGTMEKIKAEDFSPRLIEFGSDNTVPYYPYTLMRWKMAELDETQSSQTPLISFFLITIIISISKLIEELGIGVI